MSVFGRFSMSADRSQIYFSPQPKHVSQFSVDFIKIQMNAEFSQQRRKLLRKNVSSNPHCSTTSSKMYVREMKKLEKENFLKMRDEKNEVIQLWRFVFLFSHFLVTYFFRKEKCDCRKIQFSLSFNETISFLLYGKSMKFY